MAAWNLVEDVSSEMNSKLAAKINEVAAEDSFSADDTFTIYERERAATFAEKGLPGLGIWVRSTGRTGAVRVGHRDWFLTLGVDYVARGRKLDTLGHQVDVAMRAIMRVIDDQAGTNMTIAAGEEKDGSIAVIDLDDRLQESSGKVSGLSPYIGGVRLQVPVIRRENLP